MSKNNPILDPQVIAAATLSTGGSKATPAQEQILGLLAEELLRNKQARQEREELEKNTRRANIDDIKRNTALKTMEQDACLHRKPPPSHASALAGQRTHRGNVNYICQYCHKEFSEKTIPPDLRISSETIGGPIL